MSQEPYFEINYLEEGQSNGHETFNDAINRLGATGQMAIKDRDLSTPPGSPDEGDRYLVKATGTGDWAGHDGELAIYFNGWIFVVPKEGWMTWVDDENIRIQYDGATWSALPDVVPVFTPNIVVVSDDSGDLDGNPIYPARFNGDVGYMGMGPNHPASAPTVRHAIDGPSRYGDTDGSNHSDFDTDGHLTMAGTARVWKSQDLFTGIFDSGSSGFPDIVREDEFTFHRMRGDQTNQVFTIWNVPDDFAAGSASVKGHFGFITEVQPGVDGVARMGFEYKKLSTGDDFDFLTGTSTGEMDVPILAADARTKWRESPEGTCTTTGWAAGDKILFRFYRDHDHANDTYADDVWVGVYHLEYLADKLGTKST